MDGRERQESKLGGRGITPHVVLTFISVLASGNYLIFFEPQFPYLQIIDNIYISALLKSKWDSICKVPPFLARDKNFNQFKGQCIGELRGYVIEHEDFTECRNVAVSQNQLQSEIQMPLLGHYCFSYLFPFACGCFTCLPLNTSFLFIIDDYGLSRSQLLSFISLAEVIPRESVLLTSSTKILRKGLITCPPLPIPSTVASIWVHKVFTWWLLWWIWWWR